MSGRIKARRPIGVFDSGLGGLTVIKQLIKHLPHEDVIYFGDTARVPYGIKSKASIVRFSNENTHFLVKHRVKAVVVACNSSSAYALPSLQKNFDIPVVGVIGPGASAAVNATQNKRVGVIATSATVASQAYVKAIQRCDKTVQVFQQACPLFVPVIEEGWNNKPVAKMIAEEYLKVLTRARIDTLILGCTHYPLIKNVIKKVNRDVRLVDSAEAVAKEVAALLQKSDLMNASGRPGKQMFFVSDRPQDFERIAKIFLGRNIDNIKEVQHV